MTYANLGRHPHNLMRLSAVITAIFGSTLLLTFFFLIDHSRLPDYDNYYRWADQLQKLSWSDVNFREFLSFSLLKFFASLDEDPGKGLGWLYLFNAIVATFGLLIVSIRYGQSGIGVAAIYALYGPLLTYITLRATLAYLLVSLAFLMRTTYLRKLLLTAFASLFHVTALLFSFVVGSAALLRFTQRHKRPHAKPHLTSLILLLFFSGIFIQLFWLFGLGDSLALSMTAFIPGGDRFREYFEAAPQFRSAPHVAYFFFVLTIACSYLYFTRDTHDNFRVLVSISLLIFIALAASPVAAYRFSIFFMLPIFLRFPATGSHGQTFILLISCQAALGAGIFQAFLLFISTQ